MSLMIKLNAEDFKPVKQCPWCENERKEYVYNSLFDSTVYKCKECGLLYSDKILNKSGLEKYWSNYSSQVHTIDASKNYMRLKMYEIEYNFIRQFIEPQSKVLDVGCGEGGFLQLFKEDGYRTFGVEYGIEAADYSRKMGHEIFVGELPDLVIEEKFDLIIFRGTIQYLIDPKKYFETAIELLSENGLIYITSSPNSESICSQLFKEKFVLPVTPLDYYMFSERILTNYFENNHMHKLAEKYFYEETPYRKKDDIKILKQQIERSGKGLHPLTISPAWYDNMLSVVYIKCI